MSSILSSILGAGAAPPQHGAPGQSMPPDLMAAISHGAPQPAEDPKPAELLAQMIQLGHQYMQIEPDEQDKATVMQCLTQLQKVRASEQQESDGAAQGKVSPKMVRKAAAGGSYTG